MRGAITPLTDLSQYLQPSQPLPKVGQIFRWYEDVDISNRFYLVAHVRLPESKISGGIYLPPESLEMLDFRIDCITFCWSETTKSFSLFDGITFYERWFRGMSNAGTSKRFISEGTAKDFADDVRMSFIMNNWLIVNKNGELICPKIAELLYGYQ